MVRHTRAFILEQFGIIVSSATIFTLFFYVSLSLSHSLSFSVSLSIAYSLSLPSTRIFQQHQGLCSAWYVPVPIGTMGGIL